MATLTRDIESHYDRLGNISDSSEKVKSSALPNHTASAHSASGSEPLNVAGLSGRLAGSQYVTVQNAGAPLGLAHTVNVSGLGTMSYDSGSKTATITIPSTTVPDASSSTKGITKLSVSPVGDPIAVGPNDPKILYDENTADALRNAAGTPSSINPFVTSNDIRLSDSRDPNAHSHSPGDFSVNSFTGRLLEPQYVALQDDGSAKGNAFTLNFQGAGVIVGSPSGGTIPVTIPGSSGAAINVQDPDDTFTDISILKFSASFSVNELPAGTANVALVSSLAPVVMTNTTVDATPTELFTDGVSVRLLIPTDTAIGFDVVLVGIGILGTNADKTAMFSFKILGKNIAGTTTQVDSALEDSAQEGQGWSASVSISDTYNSLVIQATGDAGTTVKWSATVRTTEVAQ